MKSFYGRILSILESENDRYILWTPVCVAYGVAWYFSLRFEPPLWLGMSFLIFFAAAAWMGRRRAFLLYLFTGCMLVAFGFTLAKLRTDSIHSPYLASAIVYAEVTGKVVEIQPTPKGSKLLLREVTIDKVTKDRTPEQVSVTLRSYDPHLVTGQIVTLKAGLFPPPPPAFPGGFDFSRYFYFQEIGAVGYGISTVTAKSLKDSGANDFEIWFSQFRHRLTESIRSYFHEPAGAVAAAFITGETRAIPDEVNNNMRIAGLYHLLAVSGMNLSVVAGIAFFSLRFLLAAIPFVALRYPIKKWAAFLALIASYIYLRISGSPVSAERAFFMVSLIFIAILLDCDPMPMRSVAIAAFCILLYEPEAVLTASFQLSFSATAALIASYEWGIGYLKQRGQGFGVGRILVYFTAVITTSCIAWLATEPLIMYHFNQFSSYSLLSNTIADPLVSFMLMPLAIAGVLLLPFGMAWIAFAPMQYGVDLLLKIAEGIAHLPHAMWIVPNPSDGGFAIAVLGSIWIYFWKTRWRWCGIAAVLAGMSTAFWYAPPDIFVSDDGKHIAVRLEDGTIAMIKGRDRNISAQSWARASIVQSYADKGSVPMQCDAQGCILHLKKHVIALPVAADALIDDCDLSDIIIVNFPVQRSSCSAELVIDKILLEKNGSAALWLKEDGVGLKQTRLQQGRRPWVQSE